MHEAPLFVVALGELRNKLFARSGRSATCEELGFGNERDTGPPVTSVLPVLGRRILAGPGPTQMRPGGTRAGQGISPFAEGVSSFRLVPTIE